MMKKTVLLFPALAIIAATSAQAQTTNIYSNAYAGGTIGSGTTSLITNGATITGNITDNGNLLFMQSSAITNVNSLTGNGMVTQSGTGTTVLNPTGLNAINNFAGGFTVTSGLLDVTATAANADFRNVTVNGGVLNMTANLTSMTNLTVNGGRMNLNGTYNNSASAPITIGSGTLSLNKQDVFGTWEATIATPITINAGGVLQNGTNSANNGYVYNTLGAVTLNGGTIQSLGTNGNNSSGTAFGLKGAVSVTGSGTSTIAGAGFALGEAAVTSTTFNVGSGATLNVTGNLVNGDDASAFLYAGWGNKHPSSLIKTGSGTMLLSGTNTYTGTTTVGGGMVEFANTNSLYNGTTSSWTANNITVSNGATLAFAVGGAGQFSTSNITTILSNLGGTSGKGFLSNSSIGFDVAGGNFSLTNSLGNSTNGKLNLVVFGANTLTLTGSNSYTGNTTINSGATLQVGNGGSLGLVGWGGIVTVNGTLIFNSTGSNTVWAGVGISPTIGGTGNLSQIGSGTTTISGPGGLLPTGSTTVSAGVLNIGVNGSQELSIGSGGNPGMSMLINGGTVKSFNGVIGGSSNTVGSVTVSSGAWNNSRTMVVGASGTGSLTISGGTVTDTDATLGQNVGSVGSVTVSGGLWSNSGALNVGYEGSGSLTINGGTVINSNSFIGRAEGGSTGSVTVNSGGSWNNRADLNVGYAGSGSLTINGGTVTASNSWIAYGWNAYGYSNTPFSGSVTVNSGSFSNSGDLQIGQYTSGSLTINGGNVSAANTKIAVGSVGSTNSVTVNSGGSLNNSGDLYVGWGGKAELSINGGSVYNDGKGVIGYMNTLTRGAVTVSGGSWHNGNNLMVGWGGASNSLVISNGGSVTAGNGGTYVGYYNMNIDSNAYNSVLVTGSNSVLDSSLDGMKIGFRVNSSTVTVSNGGKLYGNNDTIGRIANSNSLIVTGPNSLYSNSWDLTIGSGDGTYGKNNSMVISNGGQANIAGGVTVGQYDGDTGNSILVTGTNSKLVTDGGLLIGYTGSSNSMVISNGGQVTSSGSDGSGIGWSGDSTMGIGNSVLITGAGSSWTVANGLWNGYTAWGTLLTVSNGGQLVTDQAYLGVLGGSNNSIMITGAGSFWSNSADINIGGYGNYQADDGMGGSGTITVGTGGSLISESIVIAGGSNSAGTLNVGTLGASDTNVTLTARTIAFGSGSGTLNFNQAGSSTISSAISGNGMVGQLGSGTTTLTGSNTYGGTTTISSGTLQVGNGGSSGSLGSGSVSNNGTLAINRSDAVTVSNAISGSGALVQSGAGTTTLTGNNSYAGTTTISSGTLQVGSGGTSGSLGFGSVINNSALTFNRSDAFSVAAPITGSGAVSQVGTGTTTLEAANTYTGLTKVSAGTLALGAGGSLATNNSVQIDSGTKFDLAANSQSLKDVKANGTIAGSGTMTVTGTLSGSGTVNADTVVTGTHSPGNSPGIQSFGGNLTYNTGAGILLQFTGNTTNNSPVNYDQILVGNNLNFNGLTTLNLDFGDSGSVVDWNNAFWQSSQSWTLYSVSGITTGFANLSLNTTNWADASGDLFGNVLSGGTFSLTQNGNNIVLNYAVPEPSTYVLFGLGALALVIAYRRKSQQAGS